MLTIDEAIINRHSVRTFTDQKIEGDVLNQLNSCVAECNAQSGLHIQLVTDSPDAFGKSLMAKYGRFRNVCNYFCLVGPKSGTTDRLLGYFGEKLVLLAQQLGLNTCWVGLSYNKNLVNCQMAKDEVLAAVIALGYGSTQGVAHKVKEAGVVFDGIDSAPDWCRRGVEYALLAPTAINQQKFRFSLSADGKVQARRGMGIYTEMDLGIAMLHFEIGAGKDNFEWA